MGLIDERVSMYIYGCQFGYRVYKGILVVLEYTGCTRYTMLLQGEQEYNEVHESGHCKRAPHQRE